MTERRGGVRRGGCDRRVEKGFVQTGSRKRIREERQSLRGIHWKFRVKKGRKFKRKFIVEESSRKVVGDFLTLCERR